MDVVALVSSAGGLDATGQVLSGLAEGFPAAVVVLQHTGPTHESRLARRSCSARPRLAPHLAQLVSL